MKCLANFEVLGTPVPQGSKKAFVIKNTNRAVLVDDNAAKLKPWRNEVRQSAIDRVNGEAPYEGPVKVIAIFAFPFLKSHLKSDGETLRDDRPFYKKSKPDTDKLQRALGDAMSGVVYKDDAQIAVWDVRRIYGSTPGVSVMVFAL